MNILLIGHSCSPSHGSEPGVAWNWAWELSAYHDVWLIAFPKYREMTDRYLEEHPNPRLHIVWVELDPRIEPWKPEEGLRGIRLHYLLWQRKVDEIALELHAEHRFDLVHHVSWNTISAPFRSWRIPVPFVWGPVGGGQVTPPAFYRYFGSSRISQLLRTARLRLMPYMPWLRAAVRNADLLLATNPETHRMLEQAGARDVRTVLDAGLQSTSVAKVFPERPVKEEMTVLWSGHFEARKCLPLALEAIARTSDVPLRLMVAGDGPLRGKWEALARQLGVQDKVQFLGMLTWQEMLALYAKADVFLFTSLNDSSGTVVVEAMGQGLPILTLNHQGVGSFVPATAGIKAPVTTPDGTIDALASGLRRLHRDPLARQQMGRSAWEFAQTVTWDMKIRRVNRWYEEVVAARKDQAPPSILPAYSECSA